MALKLESLSTLDSEFSSEMWRCYVMWWSTSQVDAHPLLVWKRYACWLEHPSKALWSAFVSHSLGLVLVMEVSGNSTFLFLGREKPHFRSLRVSSAPTNASRGANHPSSLSPNYYRKISAVHATLLPLGKTCPFGLLSDQPSQAKSNIYAFYPQRQDWSRTNNKRQLPPKAFIMARPRQKAYKKSL